MAIQSAVNRVVVQVETKYVRNFTSILRMAAIQNNTSIEPADYVNIVGKVISAPKSISNKREYEGFSQHDIKPGDTVIFSNQVIYSFVQTDPEAEPIYRNLVWYKGQEYFFADITHIFAVIRDGEIRMQNGYVMVENMEKQAKIYVPQNIKKKISSATAIVSNVDKNNPELKIGDIVYFNPNVIQLYQINGKPFGILSDRHILGKGVPDYSRLAQLN